MDASDNCPDIANADQADADSDNVGNVCDDDYDSDGDGIADQYDNCPDTYNPANSGAYDCNGDSDTNDYSEGDGWQCDQDGDGQGDACDPCVSVPYHDGTGSETDTDSDGTPNVCDSDDDDDGFDDDVDYCPLEYSASNTDSDSDTIGDVCDNCPSNYNPDQSDMDGDGTGDLCDSDSDGDDYDNINDNCPYKANNDQADADSDGVGDVCDVCSSGDDSINSDNDSIPDCLDNCDNTDNPDQTDTDGDGQGDACDTDDDGDAISDTSDTCPLDEDNDSDSDTICGDVDNCPDDANSNQTDSDGDGKGDACDNCDDDYNPEQEDADSDGIGDICDDDDDNDGVNDVADDNNDDGIADGDNCRTVSNSNQADSDSDGVGNVCDNCPNDYNPFQNDTDGDGLGNACDTDDDGDSILDTSDTCPLDADNDSDGDGICGNEDNCPTVANADQANFENSAAGDACDSDDDNDGTADTSDTCPYDKYNDADDDGICGNIDNCPDTANANQEDYDNDGVGDACDNCIYQANAEQYDTDQNGIGDACDMIPDTDGDGIADNEDNCPYDSNASQTDADDDGIGSACDSNDSNAAIPALSVNYLIAHIGNIQDKHVNVNMNHTGGYMKELRDLGCTHFSINGELLFWSNPNMDFRYLLDQWANPSDKYNVVLWLSSGRYRLAPKTDPDKWHQDGSGAPLTGKYGSKVYPPSNNDMRCINPGYDGKLWQEELEIVRDKCLLAKGEQGQYLLDLVIFDVEIWVNYYSMELMYPGLIANSSRNGSQAAYEANLLDRFENLYDAVKSVAPEAQVLFYNSADWENPFSAMFNLGDDGGYGFEIPFFVPSQIITDNPTDVYPSPCHYYFHDMASFEFTMDWLDFGGHIPWISMNYGRKSTAGFTTWNLANGDAPCDPYRMRMMGELYANDAVAGIAFGDVFSYPSVINSHWDNWFDQVDSLVVGLKAGQ